jgi:type II secretory pathway pseudopilin PulG
MQESPIFFGLTVSHLVSLVSAGLAATIVMVGWYLTAAQAVKNRQAELRTAYIVSAFEDLALAANRPLPMTPENILKFETAVAKVQLFGNDAEIKAINHFIDTYTQPQSDGIARGELDPALFALRDSLRRELRLTPVEGPVRWFRPQGGGR